MLAVVVAGLITGRRAARVLSPGRAAAGQRRLADRDLGDQCVRVHGSSACSCRSIMAGLSATPASVLIGYGVAISLTVIVARIVWVFPATYLPRRPAMRPGARRVPTAPRRVSVVSWAGHARRRVARGGPGPARRLPAAALILYLTFCVIVATLVGQGLTLPWLIRQARRRRRRRRDGGRGDARAARRGRGRPRPARGTARRISGPPRRSSTRSSDQFEHEAIHVAPRRRSRATRREQEPLDHRAIRSAVLLAQRESVIQLRDDGVINDETLRRIERELDLEAVRRGLTGPRTSVPVRPDRAVLPFAADEHRRRRAIPVHLRIGHRGPPRQDVRPDLGRHPGRDHPRRPGRARRLRDRDDDRPRPRPRRDLDAHLRRLPVDRPRHGPRHRLHAGGLRLRLPDVRDARVGQGPVAGHRPGRRRRARGARRRRAILRARRRRPGDDVRVRLPRDARADAPADRARPPDGSPALRGPPDRPAALPPPGRQDPGDGRVRARRAGARPDRRRLRPARPRCASRAVALRGRRVGGPADRSRASCARSTR